LVFGSLAGAGIACFLTLIRRRHAFSLPNRDRISRALNFSWQVLASRISWYGYSNADFFVAGRVLGDVVLGYYSLAWSLANLPIEKFTSLIGSVTPGIYSAAQHDKEALRRYVLKPIEAIGILIFPVMAGIAVIAGDAVPVVLGPKWSDAIVPLQLLSIYACVRSVMPLMAQVLVARGDARFVMWTNISSLIIFPICFWWVSLHWGAVGIAAAWIVLYPLNAMPIYLRVRKEIDLTVADFMRALWPGLSATIAMVAGVVLLKMFFPTFIAAPLRLIALVAWGAVVYLSILLLLHKDRLSLFQKAAALIRA
jgi:PST family polysaccharide transporter